MPFISPPALTLATGATEKANAEVCTVAQIGNGRWVASKSACVYSRVENKTDFPMFKYNDTQDPECWVHDNLRALGSECMEDGCRVLSQTIWHSTLHDLPVQPAAAAARMFKYAWRPYNCNLPHYQDATIRTCFAKRKWPRLLVQGASIS